MFPLTLLIISLLGILLLIAHKMWEERRGTHTVMGKIRQSGDERIARALTHIRAHKDVLSKENIKAIGREFGLRGIESANALKRRLEEKLRESDEGVVGMVRGKKKLKRRQVQSQFLHDIGRLKHNQDASE